MTSSSEALAASPSRRTIETRASWGVCLTALGIAAVSFAAPAITVVGLKSIAADLGGERSVPALAYSLAWLGASVGGIAMGHAAERFGVRDEFVAIALTPDFVQRVERQSDDELLRAITSTLSPARQHDADGDAHHERRHHDEHAR